MTQQQMWGAVVGVAVVLAVSTFVYRQYVGIVPNTMGTALTVNPNTPAKQVDTIPEKSAAVPETIENITGDIQAESATDLSALDDEEQDSLGEIQQDSESVNNFGTSYDENNL